VTSGERHEGKADMVLFPFEFKNLNGFTCLIANAACSY